MAATQREKGKVWTGARARLSVQGVKVGYATDVTVEEEIRYEPLEVLDNIEVEENVPIGYYVRVTAGAVKIIGASIKASGWFPKTGVSTEEHLKNILTQGDLQMQLEATLSDGSRRQEILVEQMKVASHNYRITARGIVAEDLNFVAIRVKDVSEL